MRLPDVTPDPLPLPGASPDDAPSFVFQVNADWMQYLRGAVEDALGNRSSWDSEDETALDTVLSQVDELIYMLSEEVPAVVEYAGKIELCAIETLPAGRLWCDGATYNRVDHPTLYAALPAAFIVDADQFTVPDMRDRVPVGKGASDSIGDTGGASTHTLTENELANHNHQLVDPSTKVFGSATPATLATRAYVYTDHTPPGSVRYNIPSAPTGPTLTEAMLSVGRAGANVPHNNMQPYLVVNYVICTGA